MQWHLKNVINWWHLKTVINNVKSENSIFFPAKNVCFLPFMTPFFLTQFLSQIVALLCHRNFFFFFCSDFNTCVGFIKFIINKIDNYNYFIDDFQRKTLTKSPNWYSNGNLGGLIDKIMFRKRFVQIKDNGGCKLI